MEKVANDDALGDIMTAHVQLGNALGIQATPGFVIKGVAIIGYPGAKRWRASSTRSSAAARSCAGS